MYKKLTILFSGLAILISNIMCAVVEYNYCTLLWGGKYAGYSAPPQVAYLYAIPFIIVILICVGIAYFFWKKHTKQQADLQKDE